MQITVNRGGQHFGPYSLEEAAAHIASGGLVPADWAWATGMTEWRPLEEIMAAHQVAPPAAQMGPPPVPRQIEEDPFATDLEDPYATIIDDGPPPSDK